MSSTEPATRPNNPPPSPGRVVLYTLTEQDAEAITRRRQDFRKHNMSADYQNTGYQAHYGNPVANGDQFPATVVRVHGTAPNQTVNLRVILDGTDDLWVTSRSEAVDHGDGTADAPEGRWIWPPRV